MHLAIVTAHRSTVGGVESYLRALLPALERRGHRLTLVLDHAAPGGGERIDDGLERARIFDAASARPDEVVASLRSGGVDAAYLQGTSSIALEEGLAHAFPTVLFAHGHYGTCISGMKRHAFPEPQPCERALGPGCLVHYLPRRCGGLSPVTALRDYDVQRRRQRLAGGCAQVLVASTFMKEELVRGGCASGRVQVTPLFPTSVVPEPEPPAPRPASGRLVFVGRLDGFKGRELFLDALALAQGQLGRALAADVAGEGPLRSAAERRARALGLDVAFHGHVPAARRNELLRAADLLVVPSKGPEPFGLVGVEAGCVGLPAAAFAMGGVGEWLEEGVSGALASPHPIGARSLADALTRALRTEADWQRLRLGAWRGSQRFTLERHLTALESVLDAATRR